MTTRCQCPIPDPVQQADKRWHCHVCSFLTDARPTLYALQLEAENAHLCTVRDRLTAKLRADGYTETRIGMIIDPKEPT